MNPKWENKLSKIGLIIFEILHICLDNNHHLSVIVVVVAALSS